MSDAGIMARKRRSEAILRGRGVPLDLELSPIEGERETRWPAPEEVAQRCVVLYAVAAAANGVNRAELRCWPRRDALWASVSPNERAFLNATHADERAEMQASWRAEALWALLWAI